MTKNGILSWTIRSWYVRHKWILFLEYCYPGWRKFGRMSSFFLLCYLFNQRGFFRFVGVEILLPPGFDKAQQPVGEL